MKQLEAISVVAPGWYGLNLQDSAVGLSPNYSLIADNCVIDSSGRIGSRKGWTMQTTTGATELSGESIEFIAEHTNGDDTITYLSSGNAKFFTGGVSAVLTDVTPAAYTITDHNWTSACLLGHSVIVQNAHEPLVYTAAGGLQKFSVFSAAVQNWNGNTLRDVQAAYGRLWAHDGTYVYWSTDIVDAAFPDFAAGTSGFLNIASVLPNNTDRIIGITCHNNFLVIFCQRNIVIYSGADDILSTSFGLSDVISNVGCIARDSIEKTGNDIIFLSASGVKSLGRVIQEKSMPMRDLTRNVRDQLLAVSIEEPLNSGNLDNVKAVYSEAYAFYLISFPAIERIYCLDMRQALEDGSARVTNWTSYKAKYFFRTRDRELLLGMVNGIGKYEGYTDNGASYRMKAYSSYLDFGNPTSLKMPKKIKSTILGGSGQDIVVKLGFDFIGRTFSFPYTIPENAPSFYNVDEYEDAIYTGGIAIDQVDTQALGSGNVVQVGVEATVNGHPVSIQKIDLFVKTGKVS